MIGLTLTIVKRGTMNRPDYLVAIVIVAAMIVIAEAAIRKEESLAAALLRSLGLRRAR
jgi:hypothetical protein